MVAQEQYGPAADTLEEAAEVYPWSAVPLNRLGQIYLIQGQWQLAEDAFNRALARDLDDALATAGLAEVYLNQGKSRQALQLWQQAAEDSPNLSGVFSGLGRTHLARLEFEAAESAFRRQLTHRTDDEALWYLAAMEAPTDLKAARDSLNRIPADAPTDLLARRDYLRDVLAAFDDDSPAVEVAQTTGIAMVQAELWPLAIYALTAASEETGQPVEEKAESLAFLGHALAQMNRPAFEVLDQAQKLAPNSALPAYFQGIYLRKKGALSAAEAMLEQAIENDPSNAAIYVELARTKMQQGDLAAAEAQFAAAVEAAPDDPEIQILQVQFYANRAYRLVETGIPLAEAFIDSHKDDAEAHELLGWMQFLVGELEDAEANLRRAIKIDGNLMTAHYHLGRFLEAQQRFEEAEAAYQTVIERDTASVFREKAWDGYRRVTEK